jgi:hypothetical protein
MSTYVSTINIPAYDGNNKGLIIALTLTIVPHGRLIIHATGTIAVALQNSLKRAIEIMSSVKKSWEFFETNEYLLESDNNSFIVKDAKSSSMVLCIALLNAQRVANGKPPIAGLSGTGILRIDGSFDKSHLEKRKYLAAKKKIKAFNRFITPHECNHLFDLEKLINQS